MKLPEGVRLGVEAALAGRGDPGRITEVESVGGGCISPTARVGTPAGACFLKWNAPGLPDGLLRAEARGLRRLGAAGAIRVPEVLAVGDGGAWLLLEWLEPGRPSEDGWRRLGRQLAELHRHRAERFGGDEANFIGSLPQDNTPSERWSGFWWERRLEPQLRRAVDAGHLGGADEDRFLQLRDRLDHLLEAGQDDGPSLLHGDLWNGNVHMMSDGTAALIDPSVYHGHREVDLAMAELFGGFGHGFREEYESAWPLAPGYAPGRRAAYQLYYLLVHVNLFGSGYLARTHAALATALDG